jgi:antitoxin ParD1/3/4
VTTAVRCDFSFKDLTALPVEFAPRSRRPQVPFRAPMTERTPARAGCRGFNLLDRRLRDEDFSWDTYGTLAAAMVIEHALVRSPHIIYHNTWRPRLQSDPMNIRLSPEHEKWLSEQVAAGAFASIDDALAWVIEGVIHIADDDLEWARPLIAEAEASFARGEGIPGDDFLAWLDHRLDTLR